MTEQNAAAGDADPETNGATAAPPPGDPTGPVLAGGTEIAAAAHPEAAALASRGNHGAAAERYAATLEQSPEDVDALLGHGAALLALGRHEAAEADLRRAVRLAPDRADVHLHLGIVLSKRAVHQAAVAVLRRAAELEPTSVPVLLVLGETLNQLGESAGAIEVLDRAARLGAGPRAYFGLGIAYDRRGEPERAAEMYRQYRELTAH